MSPMLASMSATPSVSPSSALITRARWKILEGRLVVPEYMWATPMLLSRMASAWLSPVRCWVFEGAGAGLDGAVEVALLELGGGHDVEESPGMIGVGSRRSGSSSASRQVARLWSKSPRKKLARARSVRLFSWRSIRPVWSARSAACRSSMTASLNRLLTSRRSADPAVNLGLDGRLFGARETREDLVCLLDVGGRICFGIEGSQPAEIVLGRFVRGRCGARPGLGVGECCGRDEDDEHRERAPRPNDRSLRLNTP